MTKTTNPDREDTMTTARTTPQADDTNTSEVSTDTGNNVETGDTEQDTDNPNKEAAKYRRQLRDVEAERDTLAGRVEAMQRALVDAEVHRAGYKPEGFWSREGNTPAAFFGDDGTLNTEHLTETIENTARELGLTNRRGPVAPREGYRAQPRTRSSWENAFSARND